MTVDGRSRRYVINLPPGHPSNGTTLVPLVFAMHGGGGWSEQFEISSRLTPKANAASVAVVDDLIANHRIDAKRVYATGHSNGGMMSYRLACERPDRIAVTAPNSSGSSIRTVRLESQTSLIRTVLLPLTQRAMDYLPSRGSRHVGIVDKHD